MAPSGRLLRQGASRAWCRRAGRAEVSCRCTRCPPAGSGAKVGESDGRSWDVPAGDCYRDGAGQRGTRGLRRPLDPAAPPLPSANPFRRGTDHARREAAGSWAAEGRLASGRDVVRQWSAFGGGGRAVVGRGLFGGLSSAASVSGRVTAAGADGEGLGSRRCLCGGAYGAVPVRGRERSSQMGSDLRKQLEQPRLGELPGSSVDSGPRSRELGTQFPRTYYSVPGDCHHVHRIFGPRSCGRTRLT